MDVLFLFLFAVLVAYTWIRIVEGLYHAAQRKKWRAKFDSIVKNFKGENDG